MSSAKKKKTGTAGKSAPNVVELERGVIADPRQANSIVDLLELCDSRDAATAHAAFHALHRIFVAKQAFLPAAALPGAPALHAWVHDQYLEFVLLLLKLLAATPAPLQVPALRIALDFARCQARHTIANDDGSKAARFAGQLVERVLRAVLSDAHERDELFEVCAGEFVAEYDDLRLLALQTIAKLAADKAATPASTAARQRHFIVATYTLLDVALLPAETDAEPSRWFFPAPAAGSFVAVAANHRRVFTDAWRAFLRLQLPMDVFKSVLTRLHLDVLPHLADPRWLIDFLRDSYALGGIIAILSLDALFDLIQNHNLDQPDFYPKLYALLTPEVLMAKHRPRFFRLVDKFLGSSHLPNYLVASFLKRLARLALLSPPAGILTALRLIFNLIKRHPATLFLIHRTDDVGSLEGDPFDAETNDPAQTHVLDSSLWELTTLSHHYYPPVVRLTEVFSTPYLKKSDLDVARASTSSYLTLIQTELRRAEGKAADAARDAAGSGSDGENGSDGDSDSASDDDEDAGDRRSNKKKKKDLHARKRKAAASDQDVADAAEPATTFVAPTELYPHISAAFVW